MGKTDVADSLKKYSIELKKIIKYKKLILYGSFAKGTANNDSDIDLAVIVEKYPGDFLTVSPKLWKLASQIDSRIEPIILEEGKDESGFIESISKYGVLIN